MKFQVESKGWVDPEDPDEWLPCLSKPCDTEGEASEQARLMNGQDEAFGVYYPYRVVEVED
jgi:hypothetical protein